MNEKRKRRETYLPIVGRHHNNSLFGFWFDRMAFEGIIVGIFTGLVHLLSDSHFQISDSILLTLFMLIYALATFAGAAGFIGTLFGGFYAGYLYTVKDLSSSPLKNPVTFRKFYSRLITGFAILLYSVCIVITLFEGFYLWLFFGVTITLWRSSRLHQQFIRFYFGKDMQKQKTTI